MASPRRELVRTAISRLREQLNIVPLKVTPLVEQLPPSPPVAAAPPPAQAAEPPPGTAPAESPAAPVAAPPEALGVSQQAPGSTGAWKTPVAYAAAGTGVVALGLAGFFVIDANNAMIASNKPYENNQYPLQSELPQIVQLREQATTQRILAGVSAGVGVALLGTGAYLWLDQRRATTAPGVTALSVGPGGVSVLGVLP